MGDPKAGFVSPKSEPERGGIWPEKKVFSAQQIVAILKQAELGISVTAEHIPQVRVSGSRLFIGEEAAFCRKPALGSIKETRSD